MVGFLLIFGGCFFNEIKGSITKTSLKNFGIYSVGAILSFFGLLIFIGMLIFEILLFQEELSYNIYSFPLTMLRIFLEILLFQIGLFATKHCDRSTYTLLRSTTIPILLIMDIILGYTLGVYQFIGLGIIMCSFVIFNIFHKTLNFAGWKYAASLGIIAAFTTSIYKYNISFFENSVAIEGLMVFISLTIYFIYKDYSCSHLDCIRLIRKKEFILQGISTAVANVLINYAFIYVNASVGMAVKRGASIIWGVVFGKIFFNEKNFSKKILMSICVIIGIYFLSI